MKNKIIRICLILMLMLTLCINTTYVLAETEESGTVTTENEPNQTPNEPEPTPDISTPTPEEPDQTPDISTPTPEEPDSTPDNSTPTPEEPDSTPDNSTPTPDETNDPEPTIKPSDKPATTPKPSNTPMPTEDVETNEPDDSKPEDDENSQSSVSGNITLNTVVKSVIEKEDFSGKGVSLIKIKGIDKYGKKIDFELTPKFDVNTYSYKCRVDLDIENIEINMELIDEEWSSEIIGNNKIVEGENLITIISSNEDKTENVTYQINIIKAEEIVENKEEKTPMPGEERAKNATKDIILIVCVAIIVVSLLTIGITKYLKFRKEEKNRREDKDEM